MNRVKRRRKQNRRLGRRSVLESLEQRQLLAVSPTITGTSDVTVELAVTGSPEDVYLRSDSSGNLEWSTDANSGFADLVDLTGTGLNSVEVKVKAEESIFSSAKPLHIGNIWAPGVDLTFNALHIDVLAGSTVSTRELAGTNPNQSSANSIGNSGDLTLKSPDIDVKSGANLLAHVGNTSFAAGDIKLEANASLDALTSIYITTPIIPVDISATTGKIELNTATLKGRDITVKADSDAADLFDDGDPLGGFGEALAEYVGGISLGAGVAISKADADVIVVGGNIEGRDVTLGANAKTDATALVLSIYAAVAYGQSEPHAKVELKQGAQINAAGDVSVTTFADSEMSIQASQNLVGTSNTTEKVNITLAGAYSKMESLATFSSDTVINAGTNFTVDVDAKKNHLVGSTAAAYGDGTLGTSINVGVHESELRAKLDGTVNVGGNLLVTADLDTVKNDYAATSTVGTSDLGSRLNRSAPGGVLRGFTKAFNGVFGALNTGSAIDPKNAGQTNKLAVSAAVNAGLAFNTVEVRIGPSATVDVGGDIQLHGTAEELPETSAISFLNSSSRDPSRPELSGSQSQREKGIAAALTGAYMKNTVDVYIGNNATVTAGGDIVIESETSIPYDFLGNLADAFDFGNNLVGTIQDKLNFNLGLQNALFTTWSEAIATAQQKAYGGMLNVLINDSHNYAYIGQGANVTAGGKLQVVSDTDNDTVNLVGSFTPNFNASGNEGVGAAVMVTGYIADTSAEVRSGATINAGSLLVHAKNRAENFALGLQGGQSEGFGFNGAFTGRFVDNRTVSQLSDQANVTLGSGSVSVPLSFDVARQDNSTFTSSVPQFSPTEAFDPDDTTKLRVSDTDDSITLPYDHGLTTGDAVRYDNDPGQLGSGANIDGLTNGDTYFVIVQDAQTVKLASSHANALIGTALPIGLTGTNNDAHALYPGFDPTATGAVNTTTGEITLGFDHGLTSGQPVTYSTGETSATNIGGLTNNTVYHVVVTGKRTLKLANTPAAALEAELTGTSTGLVTLTSTRRGQLRLPRTEDSRGPRPAAVHRRDRVHRRVPQADARADRARGRRPDRACRGEGRRSHRGAGVARPGPGRSRR